jgi:hypothetical protein
MIIALKIKTEFNDYFEIRKINDNSEIEKLKSSGWIEVIKTEPPQINNDYTNIIESIYENENGDLILKYNVSYNKTKIQEYINSFKQQLSDSDYKVIKNMEAQLINEEPPYDSITLHNERQVLRDKINELEELLKQQ